MEKKSGRYALKRSLYQLILAFFAMSDIFLGSQRVVKSNSIFLLGLYIIFSFSIGFFEEGLFRGIFLNGFIKLLPKTKIGLWLAVIISSFIFGFVHVMDYVPYIRHNSVSIIIQMMNKIVITGAIGMLLAAIYLKTKNIWICVIIHSLNDLLLILGSVFTKLGTTFTIPQYVDINKVMDKKMLLGIMISIPNIIIAVAILRKVQIEKNVMCK